LSVDVDFKPIFFATISKYLSGQGQQMNSKNWQLCLPTKDGQQSFVRRAIFVKRFFKILNRDWHPQ